jgi:hypothetical protein
MDLSRLEGGSMLEAMCFRDEDDDPPLSGDATISVG